MDERIKSILYELKCFLVAIIKVIFYFFIIPVIIIIVLTLPFCYFYSSKLIYSFVSEKKISNYNILYNIRKDNFCSSDDNCYFVGYCLKIYDNDDCSNDDITILTDKFKNIQNIQNKDGNTIYFTAINSNNSKVYISCSDYFDYVAKVKCEIRNENYDD